MDPADIQDDSQSSEQPLLRVIKGNPTVEEIAALTVLVASYSEFADSAGAQFDSDGGFSFA